MFKLGYAIIDSAGGIDVRTVQITEMVDDG